MTDWTKRLRRASFAGQAFYVDDHSDESGQRVNTTPIPNALWVNESFGPAPRKFEVSAYLTGDFAYARAEALGRMAENKHLGSLILPDMPGPVTVRLTKARREFRRDKLGYSALAIEAVADPPKQNTGLSANILQLNIFSVGGLIGAALGGFVSAAFAIAGQVATVVEAALGAVAGVVGDLVGLAGAVGLAPLAQAAFDAAIGTAFNAVLGFATNPVAFALGVAEAAIVLGDQADPARLAQAIVAAGRPADPPPPYVSQGSAVTIAENAGHALTMTAVIRALALGEAMARREYADRPEAIEARAVMSAVFDDALARIGPEGIDLARELGTMQGMLSELVRRQETDIAPLIEVALPAPLPSLVWAYRLYGDPSRADEVARRAGVPNPAFLPERFTALSN
jgi:prophage DNA circulation protein